MEIVVEMMPKISSLLNSMLFLYISVGMFQNARWIQRVFGIKSMSRNVLHSIYISIFIISAVNFFGFFSSATLPLLLAYVTVMAILPFISRIVVHPVSMMFLLLGSVHCITILHLLSR